MELISKTRVDIGIRIKFVNDILSSYYLGTIDEEDRVPQIISDNIRRNYNYEVKIVNMDRVHPDCLFDEVVRRTPDNSNRIGFIALVDKV
jgi:hypothetical protein